MPEFVPGIELSGAYYREAVRPVLDRRFPGLVHSAAILGPGSEVLGFDTARSRDHNWGPRVDIYLRSEDRERLGVSILEALAAELPRTFRGYSTHYLRDVDDPGTLMAAVPGDGPIEPYVFVLGAASMLRHQLGIDIEAALAPRDWLSLPQQRLRAMTSGAVYHDGLGSLGEIRRKLAWYPEDVWRYLLASGWRLIGQEEPFLGRTAELGDTIGSRVVAGRLVRWSMMLALLQARQYAPYSKWLGTAFAQLESGSELQGRLAAALDAHDWPGRERHLYRAFEELARRQNALGLSEPVSEAASLFHDRPFMVIQGERIGEIIEASIDDPEIRSLPVGVGGIDQCVDNTDVLSHPERFRSMLPLASA